MYEKNYQFLLLCSLGAGYLRTRFIQFSQNLVTLCFWGAECNDVVFKSMRQKLSFIKHGQPEEIFFVQLKSLPWSNATARL